MTVQLRTYQHPEDYKRVCDFLITHHKMGNLDGNWLEPTWEYMHFHPYLDNTSLNKIGIWEEDGKIVAVAHYESVLGEAFFEFHSACHHLSEEMLVYAEENLAGRSDKDGRKYLKAFINNYDDDFISLARKRGYDWDLEAGRPMAKFVIPDPFPPISLPEGFRLTSLAEECDWVKVHRVMWRGFNHPGEPPGGEEELESRRKLFDTPSAKHALKVAVAAPDGAFVAFCGMFYNPDGQFGYVEPVATDPSYRRMGLGKAAVLESVRRCGELGARAAYVGSDQAFYLALGFEVFYTSQSWVKCFD